MSADGYGRRSGARHNRAGRPSLTFRATKTDGEGRVDGAAWPDRDDHHCPGRRLSGWLSRDEGSLAPDRRLSGRRHRGRSVHPRAQRRSANSSGTRRDRRDPADVRRRHPFLPAGLWSVRWIAIPGAVGQIVIATAVTALVVPLWGWTYAQGMVFGLAISISSTVVLIRSLTDVGLLDSAHGRIAVGWVVVEDLAIVVVLVLLPPLAPLLGGSAGGGGENLPFRLLVTFAKVGLFGVLLLPVGTRVIPWPPAQVALRG